MTKINTQNNGNINYLNIHFNNVQPIELFLKNLKTDFKLSTSDRKCLLDTYNECGIDSFADTFSIIMKKNLTQQIKQDILPTIPLVCTDSNLRSIKEYHQDGWKATQSNKSIDDMIDISNDQIYETEQTKVFISQKDRNKVYSKIKKDNSLLSMENDKKKQETEIYNIEYMSQVKEEEYEEEEKTKHNFDFSKIDNVLLERYARDKLPKVI